MIISGAGFYFYNSKNNSSNQFGLDYQEPDPHFFDKSLVTHGDIVVKITDTGFEPDTISIKQGQKVTFVNDMSDYAWPASNPHPTHTDYPEFDPKLPMKVGQAWSFTFNKIGHWGYHNHLAPEMRGTVNVSP